MIVVYAKSGTVLMVWVLRPLAIDIVDGVDFDNSLELRLDETEKDLAGPVVHWDNEGVL